MAGIDKTWVTREQYDAVIEWSKDKTFDIINRKNINVSDYICEHDDESWDYVAEHHPNDPTLVLWNTPTYFDIYLLRNCPLDFIQKRLREQYSEDFITNALNGTSHYDTFKRNGLGKNARFSVVKRPMFNIRSCYDRNGNRIRSKRSWWMVDIYGPEDEFLSYDEYTDMFYFDEENADWTSSCAHIPNFSIKKIGRKIRKWNLPKGCKLVIKGYYVGQVYEIIVK